MVLPCPGNIPVLLAFSQLQSGLTSPCNILLRECQAPRKRVSHTFRDALPNSRRARRGFCGMSRKAQNPRQGCTPCLVLQRSGSPAKPRPRRGSIQNGPFAHQTACVCLGHTTRGVGGQIIPFWARTRMAGVLQRAPSFHARLRLWLLSGKSRMRLPVAAKIALSTAGAATAMVGSPTPPQKPPEGMTMASTFGMSAMCITG